MSYRISLYLLISAHITGFIGLQWVFSRPLFEMLVPFNLFLTAVVLFLHHQDWSKHFILFSLCAGIGGFLLEVAGVYTRVIFGNYQYEYALGPKLWGVPLTIALNWWVLVYVSGIIAAKTQLRTLPKALIGASLMTFLDFWIEPVAMRYHFWNWEGGIIPLQNYAVWFAASFVLLYLFFSLPFSKYNRMAVWVYLAQLTFFVAHNVV